MNVEALYHLVRLRALALECYPADRDLLELIDGTIEKLYGAEQINEVRRVHGMVLEGMADD